MPHTPLPNRRATVRQKCKIDGQTFYLDVGEYPDGAPGEIFIVAAKVGAFTRGVLDTLARAVSRMLQRGVPPAEVAELLRGMDFPPNGAVQGSPAVTECRSVADWIAQELEHWYQPAPAEEAPAVTVSPAAPPRCGPRADDVFALGVGDGSVSPSLERVAGAFAAGSGA